jgi:septum formation topological specificity factor MinE
MDMTITISVFPAVVKGGITTEGEPDVIEFTEDDILEVLRGYSQIPKDKQRHWQIQAIKFE